MDRLLCLASCPRHKLITLRLLPLKDWRMGAHYTHYTHYTHYSRLLSITQLYSAAIAFRACLWRELNCCKNIHIPISSRYRLLSVAISAAARGIARFSMPY